MKQTFLFIFLTAITGIYSTAILASPTSNQQKHTLITYDKTNDLVSVNAKETSLKLILKKIAQQSSLEVLFDDEADETISITLKAQTLAKAIDNILRGKNHLLQYTNTSNNNTTLTSVIVLPTGKSDTKSAKRLNNINNEAFYQASRNLSLEQSNKIDSALERWNARLKRMTPDEQQELKDRAKKRAVAKQLAQKRHEKQREKRKLQEEKITQFAAYKQAEAYQHLSEDEIDQQEQSQQNIRNQMKEQLLQQLNQADSH